MALISLPAISSGIVCTLPSVYVTAEGAPEAILTREGIEALYDLPLKRGRRTVRSTQ